MEIIFIDTEIDPNTKKVLDIGAVFGKDTDPSKKQELHTKSLSDFYSCVQGNKYICGHNIINHDLKYLDNDKFGSDINSGLPENTAKTNLFDRIMWFNSILEYFELHEVLNYEKKESLFEALFGYIPAEPTSFYYRAVAIGGYLNDNKHLIFYLSTYKPSDRAPEGSMVIFGITGNIAKYKTVKDGVASFLSMRGIIHPDANWSNNGVVFTNKKIIKSSFLHSSNIEVIPSNLSGNDLYKHYVNLADSYIKDELDSNDPRALEMLNEAYNKTTDTMIKITAKLNTFLYYLQKGNINGAEEALRIAAQLIKQTNNIDPSFNRVINIEAPTILMLYKKYR